tara:strand:- start:60 stop:974 length:915 start_codon:yes stop_codon:yes gene_type:complete
MEKIHIMTKDAFHNRGISILENIGEIYENFSINKREDITILIVGLDKKIDFKILDLYPNLKLIASPTTGLDHIDVDETNLRGIKIISLKGERSFLETLSSTAELAFGLIISLSRNFFPAQKAVLEGQWNRSSFVGNTLRGKTLGVIGKGRLGEMVINYGKSFGMKTFFNDTKVKGGIKLENLLSISDFISLHVPLNKSTSFLINDKSFKLMKPNAYLINTSRGKIVDEIALISALESKHISGYGTDVISDEFLSNTEDSLLIKYARENPNVVITPHIGGMTVESRKDTDIFIAKKIETFLKKNI